MLITFFLKKRELYKSDKITSFVEQPKNNKFMEEYNRILMNCRPDTPVHITDIVKQSLLEKSERSSFKEVNQKYIFKGILHVQESTE